MSSAIDKDDLDVVLAYLSHEWFPPHVREAYDRLLARERYALMYTGLGHAMMPSVHGEYLKVGPRAHA